MKLAKLHPISSWLSEYTVPGKQKEGDDPSPVLKSKTNFQGKWKACSHQAELCFGGETLPEKFYEVFAVIGMHDFNSQIVQHLGEHKIQMFYCEGGVSLAWPVPLYTPSSNPNLKSTSISFPPSNRQDFFSVSVTGWNTSVESWWIRAFSQSIHVVIIRSW